MFQPLLVIFRFLQYLRRVYKSCKNCMRACWWRDLYASNSNTRKYHRHIHLRTFIPPPSDAIKFNTQSFHTLGFSSPSQETTKSTKVTDTGGSPWEREDEYDSQTWPQEFMLPQEEYPYLHTSEWIHFSHCLHICVAFALEIEWPGNWCIEISSSTCPHTVFTAFVDSS